MLKRFFKLICFGVPLMLLPAYSSQAQVLLEENFDYAAGQLTTVSGGSWVTNTGTGFYIQCITGNLSYPGYSSSGIGNMIALTNPSGTAEDAYRQFTAQSSPGTSVYVSFLLKLPNTTGLAADTSTNGDYFAALLSSTTTSNYVSRVCIRKSATGGYQLGVRAVGGTGVPSAVWNSTNLIIDTTYIVALKYRLISGDGNDSCVLWVNPALGASEPAPQVVHLTTGTDPADIARFAIRQSYSTAPSSGTPNANIDGIRVGTTWGDITGVTPSNPSVSNTNPANNATNVLPDAVIQVTFDRLMNVTTIDTASFAVSGIKQSRYYPDSIRPSANSTSYTFYVQDSLRKSDTITVTLSTAIADTGGNHLLLPHSWTFYTVVPETMKPYLVSSSPANGADRIAVNSSVVLTFSEALLPASVDTSAFELLGVKNPKYPINPPVLSAGNTVVTFTPVDSLFSGDTVTVHIKPGISDLSGNVIRDTSIVFMTRVSPNLTIYDIQYTTGGSPGTSPYDGQIVTVSGVVTAVLKSGTFYIQDGPGQWNGIYIYKYDEVAVPEVGDSVTVTGDVSEYSGLTEIKVTLAGNLIIHKKGCALPEPAFVTTGTITNVWSASSESYESVLIETRNVVVTANEADTLWDINDGSGTARVGDWLATAVEIGYNPVIGDTLVYVRGIVECYKYLFTIEPRRMGDVMDNKPVKIVATIPAANCTKVPTAASIQVNFNKPMRSYTVIPANFALSGNLSGLISFTAIYDTIKWSCYLIPAQSFAPGESIKVTAYHALLDSFDRSLDGNGDGTATADSTDDYSFSFTTLLGGVPIGEIQQPGPDGFASNMFNQTVLIEGVVTGPDLYFTYPGNSTASWYLQDGTGGVNIYGGDINTFELGMRVVVEGTVTEYSGVTEISSSAAKISIWNKAQTLPAAKEMVYNQFLNEAVEGLLISFTGAISSPPSLAGGGYNMDVRNGNSPIAIRFNETAGFDIAKLASGAKVRVTGIVSQYDKSEPFSSGYQIVPRYALPYVYNGIQYPADIELLADSVLPTNAPQITNILPNPFSPDYGEVANIELNAPSADHLTLRLYDLKGRLVKTLLNNTMGGHQIVPWDGTDQMNRRVNIGIYIVHLRCVAADGKTTDQTKLLVMGTKLK